LRRRGTSKLEGALLRGGHIEIEEWVHHSQGGRTCGVVRECTLSKERGALVKGVHKLKEEGTPRDLGAIFKESRQSKERGANIQEGHKSQGGRKSQGTVKLSLRGASFCIRFLCIISLLLYFLEISIIKFLFYWFSPWGFFQGHVDQKYMCKNLVVCLFLYQHLGVKILEEYFVF
jgi:hypothetical protein